MSDFQLSQTATISVHLRWQNFVEHDQFFIDCQSVTPVACPGTL